MTSGDDPGRQDKISPEFASRLGNLGPADKVRAIVMLRVGDVGRPRRRRRREERQAIIKDVKESAGQALDEVDEILDRFGGQRLEDEVNAFGTIPVETTPPGIYALASSPRVQMIVEDQSIHLTF